jgi:ABC-type multidrug transport system fused ATPase/permease subunit
VSERIGEAVAGAQEVHANGTVVYERADFSDRLGKVFSIRFQIYLRKGQVKFLNNFLNQMAPLLFYSIGGYLVIQGDLTAGALAAALTANKDMSAPWKELLDYYQQTQDSKIKYEQVTEQFRPENMFDEGLQKPAEAAPPRLDGDVVASNLTITEDGAAKLLEGVSFTIKSGEKIAVVGRIGSGKEAAALALARLYLPTSGKLTAAGHDMTTMSETTVGARIAYTAQNAYLFSASVRDNLTYGLRQRVVAPRKREPKEAVERVSFLAETRRAGNLDLDSEADWLDLSVAGVADQAGLMARMVEVMKAVDIEDDVFQLGLRGAIDPKAMPDVAGRILDARLALQRHVSGATADQALATLIENFHPDRYNSNASLAENLLFGTPLKPEFEVDQLARNPNVLAVLDRLGLTSELVAIGRQIAETMVEIFADLPPGHEFFEQFSFISSEDLKDFQTLLARTAKAGTEMTADDRTRLLTLPFKLINARHRLGLIDDKLQRRIVEARKALQAVEDPAVRKGIAFFDPEAYNAASSIQDNILFGKLAYGQAKAAGRIGKLIEEVLNELHLRPAVIEIGLDFPVGVGGARLAPPQRQKLMLARALLKRPDLLVINEATATLDGPGQARVLSGILAESAGRTLVWVLHDPAQAEKFDRVMVFGDARLVETGTFAELQKPGTAFAELLAAAG